jgi:hypothetical protein
LNSIAAIVAFKANPWSYGSSSTVLLREPAVELVDRPFELFVSVPCARLVKLSSSPFSIACARSAIASSSRYTRRHLAVAEALAADDRRQEVDPVVG